MKYRTWMRLLATCTLLLYIGILNGCWDRLEIENHAFILAMGFDRAPDDYDPILMTYYVARSTAFDEATAGERTEWIASSTGQTIAEAYSNLRKESPHEPFMSHSILIVIGEELAREGLGEILRFVSRDPEGRRRAHILVAQDETAANFLSAGYELEQLMPFGVRRTILNTEQKLGTVVGTELLEFLQMLEEPGLEPVASRGQLMPRPPEGDIRGELMATHIYDSILITGGAVFKRDRLVGWIGETETRGLQWLRGGVGGRIIITYPDEAESHLTVKVLRVSAELVPNVTDGRPSFTVKIRAEGDIRGFDHFANPFLDYPKVWNELEQKAATVIYNDISSAIQAAQEQYHSDILGLGVTIYRQHARLWHDLEENWDDIFPQIPIGISVNMELRHTGLMSRDIRIR